VTTGGRVSGTHTLQQASPLREVPEPANLTQLKIQRRDRLGGIIHEYAQVA
jgi:putative transposase